MIEDSRSPGAGSSTIGHSTEVHENAREHTGAVQRTSKGEPNRSKRAAFVYFIRCEAAGAIKIGVARNPMSRVTKLQSGCPHELKLYAAAWERDAEAKERELHQRFADYHIRGEWFECVDEIRFFAQDYARSAGEGGVTWRNVRFEIPEPTP